MVTLGMAGLLALTCLAAWTIAARRGRHGLGAAVWATLESIGLAAIFLGVNVAVAAGAILAGRELAGGFVPVYLSDDATVLGASLVQGVALRLWLLIGSCEGPPPDPR